MQYGRPDRFNARECRPPYVPRCSFRRKMRPASNSSRARPLNLKTEHTGAQPSPTQLQASLSSAVVLCTNTAVAYSYGVLLLRCWSQGHPLLSSLLPSPLRPYCYETIAFCDLQLLYCCCKVGSQGLPPPPSTQSPPLRAGGAVSPPPNNRPQATFFLAPTHALGLCDFRASA